MTQMTTLWSGERVRPFAARRSAAPLTVVSTAAGSTEPDGPLVACDWNHGGSSIGPIAGAIYSTPGNHSATPRVINDMGISASTSGTADAPVGIVPMRRDGHRHKPDRQQRWQCQCDGAGEDGGFEWFGGMGIRMRRGKKPKR